LRPQSGRAADDLVEDAMASYLQELGQVREMLDSRYDDLKSGRVKAVDGETAFGDLRKKSEKRRAGSWFEGGMSEFVLHPDAIKDLEEVWEYIAADNLDAADRVREQIYDAIKSLVPFP
jgi:hypothetical protein